MITPRSRTVDEKILMEALFKATDLEVRFPLNMNVLDGGRVPRLMNLKEVLQAFLDSSFKRAGPAVALSPGRDR